MQGAEILDRAADAAAAPERPPPLPARLRPGQRIPEKRNVAATIMAAVDNAIAGRRLFVLLPFAMIAGLIVYAQLPVEPHAWALAGGAVAIIVLLILVRNSAALPLATLAAAFWIGVCLLPIHGHWFGTSMLARPAYGAFEARVEEIVSATAEARRIVVSGLTPTAGDRPVTIARARLVVPPEPPLAPGDIIRATLRLAPVPGPILPGAYDGQFHSYFAGVGAYGTVTGGNFELVSAGSNLDITRGIETTRMAIGARIDAVLDDDAAAIGRAMVMGDQSAITDETREVMAASGLAHIYSISGLHLSIVAGGMFWLMRWALAAIPAAATRWPVKKIAAVTGLLAAAGYMMLAGGIANVPALRSAIMLGLIFGAVLAGRRALTMRNVAIAALAIIVIDPASVFRASFQLSFAAVVALIGIYEMPRGAPTEQRNWGQRLWATIWATAVTSFIAGGATLLFSAYHFQQTAPLGVVGNVLVLPVVSLIIMPFAVLSVLAMPFGIEAPFVSIMGWGIDRMVDGAELVAGWSAGLTGNPLLTGVALIIGLVALAWFAFINNWWRLLGPGMALPLLLLFGFDQRPDLLIADTTQAVALRSADGVGLVTGQTGSFAVDAWSEHYQEVIASTVSSLHCDGLGCIAKTPQFSIAAVKNAAAFAEDCGLHDLLIARIRAPTTCHGGQIIDVDDLAAGGVHWLRWNAAAARFDIRTAIPNLTRPWRVVPP
ncbi:ComEC/Rec2 family competence protein [Devosia sp. SL43]|uniref:ComEC/Rec2 family competence protein n=1 Tax=Devosia sp. SL43 TaxID=2806348 RepID=UPI001F38B789|nr:ComEC/Rec2 family competence protein [Devosia sp. SL43]UJW86295.1 ComEC/Rec2 family competence protein [Devosia sp. SL43]